MPKYSNIQQVPLSLQVFLATDKEVTQESLKEILFYEPTTGVFTWLNTKKSTQIGTVAGNINKKLGYVQIRIKGVLYYAHRLAWLYMYGKWPNKLIDHIDKNRQNNAISNLKNVSQSENGQNRCLVKKQNNVALGVCFLKKRKVWKAAISLNRKSYFLGHFLTEKEAQVAYLKAKSNMHLYYKESVAQNA